MNLELDPELVDLVVGHQMNSDPELVDLVVGHQIN